MVYQISVVLRDLRARISWDSLADSLRKTLALNDIVMEKNGSFRCSFFFFGEPNEGMLQAQVKTAISALEEPKNLSSPLVITAKPLSEADFSALKPETADLLRAKHWLPEKTVNRSAETAIPTADCKPSSPPDSRKASGLPPVKAAGDTGKASEGPLTLPEVAEKLAGIRETLYRTVRGQQHAVYELTQGIFEGELFSRHNPDRKGPLSTFLFMGPSGVGKTFLAKEFGRLSGRPVLVVDMSEYSDNLANLKFNGDHGESAVVTGFVRKHPNAILIFDEIEKAHINTIHLFLQILDAGRLMDQQVQKEVSFRDATVIMTTNVGSSLYDGTDLRNLSGIPRNALISALRSEKKQGYAGQEPVFPESITTRMASGHVILFNHLEPYALMEIVRDELRLQLDLFRTATGVTVDCDPVDLPALLMYAGGAAADARTLRGLARNAVVREIQDVVMQLRSRPGEVEALSRIVMTVDVPENDGEIYALFHQTGGMQAAVFSEHGEELTAPGLPYLELHVSREPGEFKKLLRGVTDFVLLDPFVGYAPGERLPTDPEDIRSAGMEIFDYLLDYYPEVPVYILDTGRHGPADFTTLLSRGARGILPQRGDSAVISEHLREFSLNALIGNSIYRLGRSGRYLSYNCAQYAVEPGIVEISFSGLRLKTAVSGEDLRSVARKSESSGVGFDDVVGCRTAKEALREVCGMLADPRKQLLTGKKMPKGILLYGPPGTGKTMLAKAMANQAGAAFLPTTATSFFGSLVGQTEENIRELFRKARRYAPSVIFIDEVDAIARQRTGSVSTSHNEDALNTLLAEMDGFSTDEKRPVFLLAATNYDVEGEGNRVLDPAFVRRFDRRIFVSLPDTEDRRELFARSLKRHSIHFGEKHDAAVKVMAERSAGLCSADIELVTEMYARELGEGAPSDAAFLDTLDAYRYGDGKELDAEALRKTAYHEAGHALVSWVCGVKPLFMTVVSRGDYGGYMQTSGEDRGTHTFHEIKDVICRCLAGRAAELEVFGETDGINTGAGSDLKKARYLVQASLEDYGMGETLFKKEYEEQGEALMQAQLVRARDILAKNRSALDSLAALLIREKSLNGETIDAHLKQTCRDAAPTAAS